MGFRTCINAYTIYGGLYITKLGNNPSSLKRVLNITSLTSRVTTCSSERIIYRGKTEFPPLPLSPTLHTPTNVDPTPTFRTKLCIFSHAIYKMHSNEFSTTKILTTETRLFRCQTCRLIIGQHLLGLRFELGRSG